MRSAFDAVWDAEQQLLAVGVTTTVAFPHPVDEAWAGWRGEENSARARRQQEAVESVT
jgi:hypothetical protein